jgi:hypothetical protein
MFMKVIHLAYQRYLSEDAHPALGSTDLLVHLEPDKSTQEKLSTILKGESVLLFDNFVRDNGSWQAVISRHITEFRTARSLDDYLAVQARLLWSAPERAVASLESLARSPVKGRAVQVVAVTVGMAFLVTGAVLSTYGYRILGGGDTANLVLSLALPVLGTGATMLLGYGVSSYLGDRARYVELQEREARQSVDAALEQLQEEMSLANLVRLNRAEMGEYHGITKKQASSSYRSTQLAAALGLAVLVAGATVAVTATDTTTKVVTGALASLGTVLAGYIGRTFITTYQRALEQMNLYVHHPVVSGYLLMAERLTDKATASDDKRLYAPLVECALRCAADRAAVESIPKGRVRAAVERRRPSAPPSNVDGSQPVLKPGSSNPLSVGQPSSDNRGTT